MFDGLWPGLIKNAYAEYHTALLNLRITTAVLEMK